MAESQKLIRSPVTNYNSLEIARIVKQEMHDHSIYLVTVSNV